MSPIAITTSAGVTEWVLNAEPCNELGTTLLAALEDALAELETAIGAGESRALIIRSENPRGFSAGADLRELSEGFETRPEAEHAPALRAFIERIHKLLDRLDMLPITTIAVIHGVCFGGGLELALTCDLRIVERSARLEPEVGLLLLRALAPGPDHLAEVALRDLDPAVLERRPTELQLVTRLLARRQHDGHDSDQRQPEDECGEHGRVWTPVFGAASVAAKCSL